MSIETLIADIERRFGHKTLQKASNLIRDRETLSTGILSLDGLLDGGLLKGATHCLSGKPTSGATSLLYRIIGSIQKQDIPVIYLDMAGLFDPPNATLMGIETKQMLFTNPVSLKNALFLIQTLAKHRLPCLVIVDNPDKMPLSQIKPALRQGLITLITLASQAIPDIQVSIECQRLSWRFDEGDIISFTSNICLQKHPYLSPNQIQLSFDIPKEDERA